MHSWYSCFDENPTRDINDQMTSTSSNQDLGTCTIYMPSYPVNSGVALEFSPWLTAIFWCMVEYLNEDEDELTSSFIDYCLGCPKLITEFAEVLKNEWKIGSSRSYMKWLKKGRIGQPQG